MIRQFILAALIVALPCTGARGSDRWEFLPELFADLQGGWASNSVLDDGSGDDVFELAGDASGDLRWRTGFGNDRFLDIAVGAAYSRLWQDEGSSVEPSATTLRFEIDADVWGRSSGGIERVTVGLSIEDTRADFGRIDFGDTTRYLGAVMLTQKTDGECELAGTTLFAGRETFDDGQNAGDPLFDRSDDDGYALYGVEQTWIFGQPRAGTTCYRSGIFRQLTLNSNVFLRGGWSHRRESTLGTLFDAEVSSWHLGAQVPVAGSNRLAFEGRARLTAIDYTQPRDDDALEIAAGLRWSIDVSDREWVRYFDLRLGASWTRRDSDLPGLDYDRGALHFGLAVHLSPVPEDGSGTEGSSRVDRRDSPGGSEPVVQSDVDP